MTIGILNGPNLNLTGEREPALYGAASFDDYLEQLRMKYPMHRIEYFQSNVEGELINCLHAWRTTANGIILNAGAYTHTSLALADAVGAIPVPVVEVHISNIFAREDFRHVSYTGARCAGSISGLGLGGYELALLYLLGL